MRRKAPSVGEHTVEIMHEVGFSDAEIAALRDAKAIGGP
jgi:formyl-CoA transferase/succinate--hydroxymethylglutarate CoA-transferase